MYLKTIEFSNKTIYFALNFENQFRRYKLSKSQVVFYSFLMLNCLLDKINQYIKYGN